MENKLLAYADDATHVAVVFSPQLRTVVTDSLNRDLTCIYEWCKLWGMKSSPTKILRTIASRLRTP